MAATGGPAEAAAEVALRAAAQVEATVDLAAAGVALRAAETVDPVDLAEAEVALRPADLVGQAALAGQAAPVDQAAAEVALRAGDLVDLVAPVGVAPAEVAPAEVAPAAEEEEEEEVRAAAAALEAPRNKDRRTPAEGPGFFASRGGNNGVMDATSVTVIDQAENSRFVISDEGLGGELTYRADGDRLVLLHAEVPLSRRGKGVAGRLVQAAVDRARQSGETIAPWCGYTRRWLKDHPSETAGVTIDWGSS